MKRRKRKGCSCTPDERKLSGTEIDAIVQLALQANPGKYRKCPCWRDGVQTDDHRLASFTSQSLARELVVREQPQSPEVRQWLYAVIGRLSA